MIGNWQEQYRRMQRSYEKVNGEHHSTETYADDLYHFFMDCWHLKDWLRYDPAVGDGLGVKKAAEADPVLKIAGDLADGAKHFRLDNPKRGGAKIVATDVRVTIGPKIAVTMKHRVKNDAGDEFVAEDIARQAVEAWDEILITYGLSDPVWRPGCG